MVFVIITMEVKKYHVQEIAKFVAIRGLMKRIREKKLLRLCEIYKISGLLSMLFGYYIYIH